MGLTVVFFLFGGSTTTWTPDISDPRAEVKTGDKEISIQIAQVHTSGFESGGSPGNKCHPAMVFLGE